MNNQDQYYIIHSDNNKNFPMMSGETKPRLKYLYTDAFRDENKKLMIINNRRECKLAPKNYSYTINLAKPIPVKPEFVDFHTYDLEQSVSLKFVKTFEGFPGVQFVQGTGGNVIDDLKLDYYYLHYLHSIKCVDLEKSEADMDGTCIMSYEQLVLDYDVLNNIPEEQRLIFWLIGDPMTCVAHQKFVDLYNEAGLKGARFLPIKQYNEETAFM